MKLNPKTWFRKRKRQPVYNADGLCVWNKNTEFLREPKFSHAYAAGMNSGHKIGRRRESNKDLHLEWRIHVLCWAAHHAAKLPGDFVECGVNTGIFSLAVCQYIDFNNTGKHIYLFDTFEGIPEDQLTEREQQLGREKGNEHYEECYETALRNFAPYPNAHLVRGRVPATLNETDIQQVCYLSIDMNIVAPEIAAIQHFWPKLTPGAPVILDDYGWLDYVPQKEAMDEFAERVGCKILTLPTGQGMLLKPPE